MIARQFGLENVVAVLGTALGPRHIQLLRRFADRITLLLDGDEAGRRRASEILELFIANQVDLRIVTLPGNLDPCDFLLQHGRDALLELVAHAPDAWEYKIQLELQGVDPVRDTHRANQALENLLSTFAKSPGATLSTASAQRIRRAADPEPIGPRVSAGRRSIAAAAGRTAATQADRVLAPPGRPRRSPARS